MRNFIITTDTTCDLPEDYISKHGLTIIPLAYMIDDVIYDESNKIPVKDFYNRMRSGIMPTTMACVPEQVRDIFEGFVKQGFDILHIAFSSALSCSYNNCVIVANDIMEDYPDAKISVVDSLSASMGEGLMVHKALKMQEAGASIDEIVAWIEENKLNFCQQFTVDDLHHLHRGGRVSKTTAIVGTLINVKPVLHVTDEGKLHSLSNVRGRKKALNTLVDNMIKNMDGYDGDTSDVFISHGDCLEDAEYVAELIRTRLGIQNITISYISATIGAHAGPNTVALFYMGNKR